MNKNIMLMRISRISAWLLLVLMILFLVSGYAWVDKVIMPLQQARWIHTQLDTVLVFFFLVHTLISIKFAMKRWRLCQGAGVNISLLIVGLIAFFMVLSF